MSEKGTTTSNTCFNFNSTPSIFVFDKLLRRTKTLTVSSGTSVLLGKVISISIGPWAQHKQHTVLSSE